MSDEKRLPIPGDPNYSEQTFRRGITLSWLEATKIIPELAAHEMERLSKEFGELEESLRCATNRERNSRSYIREAIRCLGVGDNDAASRVLKAALLIVEPAE
jgi:hypothetical protein